jgi:chemotaxis methyl-accepting protein methylase
VPALAARGRPFRVLSIGCSTGAEPYSVAILLAEAGLLHAAEIVGVDCRADAVARARAGIFSTAELAAVDTDPLARHIEPPRSGARMAEPLRRAARWRQADATREIPPGAWDLVLCRNLFIYLQPRVVEAMLERISAALAPGGFLVVGKAERPPAHLRLEALGRCVYESHAG